MERLHKVLAHAGAGSRRRCEESIRAGKVEVDGRVVTKLGTKVDPERSLIRCEGRRIQPPRYVYYLLNKPKNVLSSARDPQGRRTVLDFLPRVRERVYPVGRLDSDSEGLVLLTNDGELCHRLTHPRFEVPRTYHVVVGGEWTPSLLKRVQGGVWLSEGRTGRNEVWIKKRMRGETVLEVTLHEGMNREVRRIFAHVGLKVRQLTRIRMGPLSLSGLGRGSIRPLTSEEIRQLKTLTAPHRHGRGKGESNGQDAS